MMRAITGMIRPQSGSIVLDGAEISEPADASPGAPRAGPVPADRSALHRHDGARKRRTRGRLCAGPATLSRRSWRHPATRSWNGAAALLDLVGIADAANALPAELPLGHLKRLEVARALALDSRMLLLDEPLAGLNSVEATRLSDTVVRPQPAGNHGASDRTQSGGGHARLPASGGAGQRPKNRRRRARGGDGGSDGAPCLSRWRGGRRCCGLKD